MKGATNVELINSEVTKDLVRGLIQTSINP